jgi:arginase
MEGANMAGFTLVGVPSSAGTHGIGQEQAPLQFRRAGLVERLIAAGIEITDDGDLPLAQIIHADRSLAWDSRQVV